MPANTEEVFRKFVGHKLAGVLMDDLHSGHSGGLAFTLVFEEGDGIVVYNTGAYAVASKADVERGIAQRQNELDKVVEMKQNLANLAAGLPAKTKKAKKNAHKSSKS